jgi:hypothetical protein
VKAEELWKERLLAVKGESGIGGRLIGRDTWSWDEVTFTSSSSRAKSPVAITSTFPDLKNDLVSLKISLRIASGSISSGPERLKDPCEISILPPNEQFLQVTVMPSGLALVRVSWSISIQPGT